MHACKYTFYILFYHLGYIALMLSVIGFAACIYFKVPVTLVYDSFLGIITATILWSVTVAVIVYVMARKQKTGLAPGGKTGTVHCMWSSGKPFGSLLHVFIRVTACTGHEILDGHDGMHCM